MQLFIYNFSQNIQYTRYIGTISCLFITLAFLIALGLPASGKDTIIIEEGKGIHVGNLQHAESIFVADPSIADIRASANNTHYIYGKAPGETTLIATNNNGDNLFTSNLIVIHDLGGLQRMLKQRFPRSRLSIKSARGSIYISGHVPTERIHDNVIESMKAFLPDNILINEINISNSKIIQLNIQIMEISREDQRKYNLDWFALIERNINNTAETVTTPTSGFKATNLDSLLDLLLSEGIASIKTETTLSTINNKEATISVGREIALPKFSEITESSSEGLEVDFKFVGIDIKFLPKLLPGGNINMKISSQISNLLPSSQFVNGNSLPNISSRNFSSYINLVNNQSFIITRLSSLDTLSSNRHTENKSGLINSLFGNNTAKSTHRNLLVVATLKFNNNPVQKSINQLIERPIKNLGYILMKRRKKNDLPIHIHGKIGFLY